MIRARVSQRRTGKRTKNWSVYVIRCGDGRRSRALVESRGLPGGGRLGQPLAGLDQLGDVGVRVLPVVRKSLVPLAGPARVAQPLVNLRELESIERPDRGVHRVPLA